MTRGNHIAAVLVLALLCAGCFTFNGRKRAKLGAHLEEESRALTTGVVDSLNLATNAEPAVAVARALARQDQRIEGLPDRPIDVSALVASNAQAIAELRSRFAAQDAALAEFNRRTGELVAIGESAEREHNRSLWRRLVASFGISGALAAVVALFVFFPPAIAIVGRLLGWVVSRLPGIASAVGVVSVRAFDAAVRGVEKARAELEPEAVSTLEDKLSRSMDEDHKRLVRARKTLVTA